MSLNVVGIGEVLWDILPDGPQLGGAPLNFAYHAKNLGAEARVIACLGDDPLGHAAMKHFDQWGIERDTLQIDSHHSTGRATVALDQNGVPRFTIDNDAAWDHLSITPAAVKAVTNARAICFGSLAQRTDAGAAAIQALVAASPSSTLRVLDINLRQSFYNELIIRQSLALADVLKLNDQELPVLARLFGFAGPVKEQIRELADRFELKLVALTRGHQGSLLYQAGQWSERDPESVTIVDTVGAGDAFTAALTMGLLAGMDLAKLHTLAASLAGHVCSQAGATPPVPDRFRAAMASAR